MLFLIKKSLASNKLLGGTIVSRSPCNKSTFVFENILLERSFLLIILPEKPTIELKLSLLVKLEKLNRFDSFKLNS